MASLKPAVNNADHFLGDSNAPITLVEFGDYECPHCGRAHPLIQRVLKEVPTNLQFVFRNFPLSQSHPHAFIAALAAEAAGKQGKFWEMHDQVFEHQNQLSQQFLLKAAERLDLDKATFERDWESEETQDKVNRDFESGVRSGVNGTPTFFLNGKAVLTYNGTYESLLDAIQLELEMNQH